MRVPALLGLLSLVYFSRFLLGDHFFFSDDMGAFKYPMLEYAKQEVLAGRVPLWDPYRFCGVPCLANLQAGFYYPPNWLCLVMPTERYVTLAMVAHVFWGGLGMYRYCRLGPLGRESAFVGAVGFAFSGALISQLSNLGLICTLSWFPWLVVALERRLPYVGAIILALQVLCGQQQSILVLVPGAAVLYLMDGHDVSPWRDKLSTLAVCIAGGIAASCAVWLPGLEFLALTTRRSLPLFGFNDQYSLGWDTLPAVLLPELDWSHLIADETSLYFIPTTVLALAVLSLAQGGTDRQRRARHVLWGTAIVAFLLAFGPKLFLGRWLVQYVPGFRQSRSSIRWLFLTITMVAILAARAWESLRSRIPSAVLRTTILCAIALDVLLLGMFAYPPLDSSQLDEPPVLRVARSHSTDGRTFLVPYLHLRDFNWCLVTRTPTATGYDPLALDDYTEYVAYASRGRLMTDEERANLSYNINVFPWGGYKPRFLALLSVGSLIGHGTSGQSLVRKPVSECLGRFYLVDAYDVTLDKEETFRRIEDPAFPLGKMALLEQALPPPFPAPQKVLAQSAAPGRVVCESYLPNRIRLHTDSARPSILVLSEIWYPGWRAYIDGERADLLRAFSILRAVPVPAGAHRVEVVFEPTSVRVGLVVSLLGFAACLTGWALQRRKSQRLRSGARR